MQTIPAAPWLSSPGTPGPPATARTCGSATSKDRPRTEFLQCFIQQKCGYRLWFVYVLPVLFALARTLLAASRLCPGPAVHSFIPVKCKLMGCWKSRGFFFFLLARRQVAVCNTALSCCWQGELPFLPHQNCGSTGEMLSAPS